MDCRTACSETTLRLGIHTGGEAVQACLNDASKDFPNVVEEENFTVIIAVTAIALVLVERGNPGIAHALKTC